MNPTSAARYTKRCKESHAQRLIYSSQFQDSMYSLLSANLLIGHNKELVSRGTIYGKAVPFESIADLMCISLAIT